MQHFASRLSHAVWSAAATTRRTFGLHRASSVVVAASSSHRMHHHDEKLAAAARSFASSSSSHFPPDVGVVALDVYFPSTFVSQADLGKKNCFIPIPQGERERQKERADSFTTDPFIRKA